ncbi:MAG TPA: 3'-5' exonuclease [Spirochaetota bacterium]|nr:3'-5' exonuclease [Spirochaetota bacterium]HOM38990.1 3'-5' exonuclease [Spirochaetota bacterium]HPQ48351.1 3'-5' exonuclease [Spirochaetota bacterium]
MEIMKELNEEQSEAVTEIDKPVFVLSGAGTGKTRVITYKIAYLVLKGYKINSIFTAAFNNKAANEIKTRVHNLLNKLGIEDNFKNHWIGTFHSNSAKILRHSGEKLGYTQNFTILDSEDTAKILKEIIEEEGLNYPVSKVMEEISKAKNLFLEDKDLEKKGESELKEYYIHIGRIFKRYNNFLFKKNLMDFDDLIINTVKLFYYFPNTREFWQQRFKYILVDEFQDINQAQYLLINLLTDKKNITVVGDDDQSIYSFRGADPHHSKSFIDSYDKITIIRVVKNYRSTPEIIELANNVIKKNTNRIGKELIPKLPSINEKPYFIKPYTNESEAEIVVSKIKELLNKNENENIGVIYRLNSQSRLIEEQLIKNRINYRILGSRPFYDRMEIKDILAYLRIIVNPKDDVSIKRVINIPKRNIGQITIKKIIDLTEKNNITFIEAIKIILDNPKEYRLSDKTLKGLKDFYALITEITDLKIMPKKLLDILLDSTDYIKYLGNLDKEEERKENVLEFKKLYESFFEEQGGTLEDFVTKISLLDSSEEHWQENKNVRVNLTTCHTAKGLEFDNVFVIGLVEDIFPHKLSTETLDNIEEERRLFYVAITRAKKRLFLSSPLKIRGYGTFENCFTSRFIKEDINPDLVQLLKFS